MVAPSVHKEWSSHEQSHASRRRLPGYIRQITTAISRVVPSSGRAARTEAATIARVCLDRDDLCGAHTRVVSILHTTGSTPILPSRSHRVGSIPFIRVLDRQITLGGNTRASIYSHPAVLIMIVFFVILYRGLASSDGDHLPTSA